MRLMEDDEETKNASEPSAQQIEGLTMDDKPLETLEVEKTEQWGVVLDSLPVLSDNQTFDAKSPVPDENDGAVAEEDTSTVGHEVQTEGVGAMSGALADTSSDTVEGDVELQKSVSVLGDSSLVDANAQSPLATEGDEVAAVSSSVMVEGASGLDGSLIAVVDSLNAAKDTAEEEVPAAGTGMDMRAEAELVESCLGGSVLESGRVESGWGNYVSESDDSLYESKDGAARTEGKVLMIGSEMGSVEDGALRSGPCLDEQQSVAEGKNLTVHTVLEMENEAGGDMLTTANEVVVNSGVKGAEGGVSSNIPFLEEPQPAGVTLTIADEVVMEGEVQIPATAMETENESVMEKFGTESALCAKEVKDRRDVSSNIPVLEEPQPAGVYLPIADEVAVKGEVQIAATATETENEVETINSVMETFGTESALRAKEVQDRRDVIEQRDDSTMEIEVASKAGMTSVPQLENSENVGAELLSVAQDDEDEATAAEDEILMVDTEMETETDVAEMAEAEKGVGNGGKRKRGKNSRVPSKASVRKVIEEDVCFICFDGGDLVLCDRRGCPKAYHPSCVNRDEAFFRAKGRWNCGWHLCSICERNAYYMCYTCTFSLCKACSKDAVILCARGNKGFCETCMKTVTLIENNEQGNKEDFDDKSSWLFLFKDYWMDLKQKLSLSSDELTQAKNPYKGSDALAGKRESLEETFDGGNHQDSGSDSDENLEVSKEKRRKTKKRLKSRAKEETSPAVNEELPAAKELLSSATAAFAADVTSKQDSAEWASKELLEFVMHMKNGDKACLSQFDVQALLLEYIKTNKLRDPRRKSQIICDARLQSLFGKPRVGHFEMLKLLESHFLLKEDFQTDDIQGSVVDNESNQLDADGTSDTAVKGGKHKKRKMCKKGYLKGPQSNLDDYAAIDMHNISLIFLRRKLVEDLFEDMESFCDKVIGTFVRIRISASNQKQDIYRLVQVLGTGNAPEPYKVGKRTTDLMLEILNLNKKELVSIDSISNQEFTEEECKRLRQSIKCGLINRLSVGDILDKAVEIQAARVNDWLETETVRLSHLRDRASEKGRRKELRECVEKLQLLKTSEERRRRLDEVPEIHADPNMDPSHESEEDDTEIEENKQESFMKPRGPGFSRIGREPISPRGGNLSSMDSWSAPRQNSGKNWEANKNIPNKDFSNKGEVGGIANDNAHSLGRDTETLQNNIEKVQSSITSETLGQSSITFVRSESFSGAASDISEPSLPAVVTETATKINESEKLWHYKDPSGKVQGPFSIAQLRKWSKNGYFPADLKIWKTTETEDDSILLTDALAGKVQKELLPVDSNPSQGQTMHSSHLSSVQLGREGDQNHGLWCQMEPSSSSGLGSLSVEVPKLSANRLNDSFNLPSPTPNTNTPLGTKEQASETQHSSSSLTVQAANLAAINQNGNQENVSVSSLLNSGRQLISGFENDSMSSFPSSGPALNSEQVIHVGSTITQPAAVLNGAQGWGSGSVQTQEMVVPFQTTASGPQATISASSQNLEPNPSLPVPAQQQAGYSPWGTVPSTVQNPSGSYSMPSFAALSQPDPWRPPVSGNPPNFLSQAPPNVPWGMGIAENANPGWGMVQGNPNMGWGGFVPGAPNMNWGAMVNPGWVAPTGNPVAMVQAMPPGNVNSGWVAQPVNQGSVIQGPPPGNVNAGWGPPPGTPGTNVQGPVPGNVNQVWGTPPGGNPRNNNVQGPNPSPGNANPGWGTPPGNSGGRGNEKQRSGNRFSGRDRGSHGGRPYNRQASFGNNGQRIICPFHKNGHCKKGSGCDMVHQ